MAREAKRVDISHIPELLRLAEEVQQTKQPRLLQRGDQDVALLLPVESPASLQRSATGRKRAGPGDRSILNLVGIADTASSADDAMDVSSNKHKYLAEAYYSELRPPKEQ